MEKAKNTVEQKTKSFIYDSQAVFFGERKIIGFGNTDFYIKEIPRDLANSIIVKNHYSHKFYSASYIHLGVWVEGELLGVLQFGYAMNPASGKSVVRNTKLNQYLELNRMWLDDKAARNSESKAISYALKYIRARYPRIKWIQSFADERCKRFGVVYQACSFSYYGEHTTTFWTYNNEVFHKSLMERNPDLSKSAAYIQEHKAEAIPQKLKQFRYIKFLDSRWKKDCLFKEKPYPKHTTDKDENGES